MAKSGRQWRIEDILIQHYLFLFSFFLFSSSIFSLSLAISTQCEEKKSFTHSFVIARDFFVVIAFFPSFILFIFYSLSTWLEGKPTHKPTLQAILQKQAYTRVGIYSTVN